MLFEEYQVIQKDGLYHVVEHNKPEGNTIALGETRTAAFLNGHKYLKLINRFKRLLNQKANGFIIYLN